MFETITQWIFDMQWLFFVIFLAIGYGLYRLMRWALGRVLYRLAVRTESVYDDLFVDRLHPFRFAWLVPLGLMYIIYHYAVGREAFVTNLVLYLIIIVTVDFAVALLNGFNDVYQQRPTYTGASIAAYIDLIKVVLIVGVIFVGLVMFTDSPPAQLIAGVGTWLAVLLLIFRDTILSFVASIQISTLDMLKDGDWIEVPSYGADGTVENVSLNAIKVKNADMTTTLIPTYKIVDVAFKNYRGVAESGGRRLKTSIMLDLNSVKFCDYQSLQKLRGIALVADFIDSKLAELDETGIQAISDGELPLQGSNLTNVEIYRKYAEIYLRQRKDLRQRRFTFIVRILEPTVSGLPLEIYVFTKKTDLVDYEATRGEILMHLLSAASYFDLNIYQG